MGPVEQLLSNEKEVMKESLKLEIEDLEERIAPGIATLTVGIISASGPMDVVGPAAATGGAVTAFTNVSAHTAIANIDVNIAC